MAGRVFDEARIEDSLSLPGHRRNKKYAIPGRPQADMGVFRYGAGRSDAEKAHAYTWPDDLIVFAEETAAGRLPRRFAPGNDIRKEGEKGYFMPIFLPQTIDN